MIRRLAVLFLLGVSAASAQEVMAPKVITTSDAAPNVTATAPTGQGSMWVDSGGSTHMLPWPVGAVAAMLAGASEVVITFGAITSCALAADAPSRTSSASLRIILTPPSAGLASVPQVANSVLATCLGADSKSRFDTRPFGQLPAGTHTPSDRSRMRPATCHTNGTWVPKKKYASTLQGYAPSPSTKQSQEARKPLNMLELG